MVGKLVSKSVPKGGRKSNKFVFLNYVINTYKPKINVSINKTSISVIVNKPYLVLKFSKLDLFRVLQIVKNTAFELHVYDREMLENLRRVERRYYNFPFINFLFSLWYKPVYLNNKAILIPFSSNN